MSRRLSLVLGVPIVIAVGVAAIAYWQAMSASPPVETLGPPPHGNLPYQAGSVATVELRPYPEGPPGPMFSDRGRDYALPLKLISSGIPSQLPRPLHQAPSCAMGSLVVLTLVDGPQIKYGPCKVPTEIEALKAKMFEVWDRRAGELFQ